MPASDPLIALNQFIPWLSAIAVAMGRPAGAAIVLPVFTRAQLGGPIRGAVAFALGLPAMPSIYENLVETPRAMPFLALIGAKELIIGIMIGLLIGLPIWGIQGVGELLDTQRSATQGHAEDPGSGNQDSTMAGFLAMAVIGLFVLSGGLNLLAHSLAVSESVWPPLSLTFKPRAGFGDALLGLLDKLTIVSLTTGAPIMLAMLLCEAAVILLMRAIPKLHLYDLAPTLRNLVFVLIMFGYSVWLVAYMRRALVASHHVVADLQQLLAP
ncbi:type III secretion system export apparatus subunit SctT [Kozakia baliensis]|uniref:type III secretion system export apparatus subunit SctT n=1 Tax=Kozakia baliensis TaxID=153496 RepID=UPI00345BD98C